MFGMRYLWIDSLRIFQGEKDDWHRESTKMAETYGNSWLTLAAAISKDCDGGLFRSPSPVLTSVEITELQGIGLREPLFVRTEPQHKVHNSLLLQRVWTYQERLLFTVHVVLRSK